MIKLLTYWIVGIVLLSIVSAAMIICLLIYQAVQQDYFFIVVVLCFVVLPLFVGAITYAVREMYHHETKGGN